MVILDLRCPRVERFFSWRKAFRGSPISSSSEESKLSLFIDGAVDLFLAGALLTKPGYKLLFLLPSLSKVSAVTNVSDGIAPPYRDFSSTFSSHKSYSNLKNDPSTIRFCVGKLESIATESSDSCQSNTSKFDLILSGLIDFTKTELFGRVCNAQRTRT